MSSFNEANQAKLSLKMLLHFYSWFNSISVETEEAGYNVIVTVSNMDAKIRKIIPICHKGVNIKTITLGSK